MFLYRGIAKRLVSKTNDFVIVEELKCIKCVILVDSLTIYRNTSSDSTQWQDFTLSTGGMSLAFRWDYVLIYVGLKVVQGGGAGGTGLLNNLRSLLWISVEQFTTREVQVRFLCWVFKVILGK